MPLENLYVVSDVGLFRTNNEDAGFARLLKDSGGDEFALAIVADGVGGAPAGEVASRLTVDEIARAYDPLTGGNPGAALARAIKQANRAVFEQARSDPSERGMCATVTAAAVLDSVAYIGQIGDSRAYLRRGPELRQITEDHSYVNDLVKQGLLDRKQARTHPDRNIITKVVGLEPDIEPDIYTIELRRQDVLLLCSDGLSDMAPDEAILAVLAAGEFKDAGARLIKLAKDYGGKDNITVALVGYGFEG